MFFTFVCLLIPSLLAKCQGDYVPITRNPIALDNWARAELQFANYIRASLQKNPDFLQEQILLEEYWRDLTSTLARLRGYDPEASLEEMVPVVSGNPLAVLRMTSRIVYILRPLVDKFPHGYIEELDVDLGDIFPRPWLQAEDVEDTALGLLRLSFEYNYPAEKVAQGFLGDVDTGVQLDSAHCYDMGFYAPNIDYYESSIAWARLSLQKLKEDNMVSESLALELLQESVAKHDKHFHSVYSYFPHLYKEQLNTSVARETARERVRGRVEKCTKNPEAFPDCGDIPDEDFDSLPAFLRRLEDVERRRDVYERNYAGKVYEQPYNHINAWVLCSKGDFQTAEEKSKLFCWNEFRVHPYWFIGPLKMEFLGRDPDVVQIYGVIGPKLTEKLQQHVHDGLMTSTVVNSDPGAAPGATKVSSVRTSVNGWISEEKSPMFKLLPRVIEVMTGLNVRGITASDDLQVASYTFGGHYDVHLDAFLSETGFQLETEGNRIATFMYYLDEPEFGGYTAFPQAKVAARPVKGSAVFWHDVHQNGEPDYHTYHGACPVIMGRKWVANKWIRFFDQFLIRKCGLNPTDRFLVAVNGDKDYGRTKN